MSIYLVVETYRSPNKQKKGDFKTFKKGEYVQAEMYSSGLSNAAPMAIFDRQYIIPLSKLQQLTEAQESEVLGALQQKENFANQSEINDGTTTQYPDDFAVVNPSENQNSQSVEAPIMDIAKIKGSGSNYAIGGALGGVAGFFLGRCVRQGGIVTALFTVAGVVGGAYYFNKYKTNKAKNEPKD